MDCRATIARLPTEPVHFSLAQHTHSLFLLLFDLLNILNGIYAGVSIVLALTIPSSCVYWSKYVRSHLMAFFTRVYVRLIIVISHSCSLFIRSVVFHATWAIDFFTFAQLFFNFHVKTFNFTPANMEKNMAIKNLYKIRSFLIS